MIILDTNVLSTLMRKLPNAAVVRWLDRQPAESIWITSVTLFEARLGLALLPDGKRRAALASAFARAYLMACQPQNPHLNRAWKSWTPYSTNPP